MLLHSRSKAVLNKQYSVKIQPDKPAKKRSTYVSPINDAEQLALNRLIDSRITEKPDPGRTLKPGDPEFDRIAGQITKLENISNVGPQVVIPTFLAMSDVGRR